MLSNHSGAEISAELAATANEPSNSNSNSNSNLNPMSMSYSHQPDSNHLLDTNKHFLTKIIHQQFNPSTSSLPSLLVRSLVALNEASAQVVESSLGSSSISSRSSNNNNNLLIATNDTEIETSSFLISKTSNQPQQLHLLSASDETDKQPFSNRWSDYWSKQPFPSGYTQSSITLLACLITTIIFLIVVGNLLVCIAIFTEKSLKPTQNWFIASLAVSDMMLGLVVMPFSLARELMGFWVFGQLWCDIHEAIDVLLTTASINTLCLISLDRYWSITQAVSYLKKRTPRRGAFMIAFVWIFSAAVSLPPLFGWRKQQESIVVNLTTEVTTTSTESTSRADDESRQLPSDALELYSDTADHQSAPSEFSSTEQQDSMSTGSQSRRRHNHRHRLLARSPERATPLTNLPDQLDDTSWLSSIRQSLSSFQQNYPTESSAVTQTTAPLYSTMSTSPAPTTIEYPLCQLSDDVGYVLYSALGSFYIPCAVMVFTYIKIFLAARSRARRAISKQSRSAQSSKVRGRRTTNSQQTPVPPATSQPQIVESNEGSALVTATSKAALQASASSTGEFVRLDPPPRGKIVIVERRKSLAIQATDAGCGKQSVNYFPTPTYTSCSTNDQLVHEDTNHHIHQLEVKSSLAATSIDGKNNNCTLTTSGVRQASRSCLNSSPSNDSSMITVMNASMGELPVTRFNFHTPTNQASSAEPLSELANEFGGNKCDIKGSNGSVHEDGSKAAKLLRAISQGSASCNREQEQLAISGPDTPNSLSDTQVMVEGSKKKELALDLALDSNNNHQQQLNTTNESCFMTIEEDSDMFDAQTGRTIVLVANVAPSQYKQQVNRQPQPEQMTTCGSQGAICRRRHTRSGSSYCDSSMTINDDDDDMDECAEVDDELLTDECNGFSISCNLDQYSSCPHCQQCQEDEEDDHDDENDDDEDAVDDQEGEEESGAQMSPSALTESELTKVSQNSKQLNEILVQNKIGSAKQQKAAELLKLSPKHHHRYHHHTHHGHQHQYQYQYHKQSRLNSETEAHSITGDDNLSVTECKSNEDGSSILGHDVLDATERPNRVSNKKKNSMAPQANALPSFLAERKKSYIGFRLSRLASSAPLTAQAGGLLDLAISSQQQSASNMGAGGAGGVSSGGPRNLKALRQNFFMKLNQLTAKSAAKQERKIKSSSKRHHGETSPTGKSSAHSSGTSFEPSVDYATTSNVHSIEYPPDTTTIDESHPFDSTKKSTIMTTDLYEKETVDGSNQTFKVDRKSTYPSSSGVGNDGEKTPVESKNIKDGVPVASKTSDDKTLLLRDHPSPSIADSNKTGQRNSLLSSNNSTLLPSSNGKPIGSLTDQQQPMLRSKTLKTGGIGRLNHTSSAKASLSQNAAPSSVTNRAYLASDNERHKRKLAKARERRATLILGLIMAAFICSWLPFFTFYVLRALCHVCRDYISARFESFIFWMGYCNSAINPIIYTIFNRDFRKAFRKILFKCL